MRIFGHVQTPLPPLYAFVYITVDTPPPLDAYVINGSPLMRRLSLLEGGGGVE